MTIEAKMFLFWLRTSEGDILFDRRIGTWGCLSREFADGIRDTTRQTVFFHTEDDPQHRSWSPWFMAKQEADNAND